MIVSTKGYSYDKLKVDIEPEIFKQLFRDYNFYEVEFDKTRSLVKISVIIPV